MRLSDISIALNATLENADPDTEITGVAGIEHAAAGQLTFVSNPKYNAAAKTTKASAVIVSETFPALATGMLRSKNPISPGPRPSNFSTSRRNMLPESIPLRSSIPPRNWTKCAHRALRRHRPRRRHRRPRHHPPHVVIYRGATIGHNFFAHAHAIVREFCHLGDNVLLQNGAVIGSDGFGFAKTEEGNGPNAHWHKIVQSGNVVVESDAEIQANACIDRASIGETRIGQGAKIDNLVHVGHSCIIGHDTLLCAQVGLAGTTDVGNHAILAGQVGVSGHVKIGDGAIAIAQSGIPQDVPAGAMVSGAPAIDHKLWLKCCAAYPKLPEIAKAVRRLSERQ